MTGTATHERGRSRLHLHGLGGDAVADVPQIFVEEVFHALVQDFYRGAHGADDPSADDSLGQLEMVKAEEVNPLVEIEQALGYIVQAEKFLVPAIEVIYRQVELSQLGLEGLAQTGADVQQSEEAGESGRCRVPGRRESGGSRRA